MRKSLDNKDAMTFGVNDIAFALKDTLEILRDFPHRIAGESFRLNEVDSSGHGALALFALDVHVMRRAPFVECIEDRLDVPVVKRG